MKVAPLSSLATRTRRGFKGEPSGAAVVFPSFSSLGDAVGDASWPSAPSDDERSNLTKLVSFEGGNRSLCEDDCPIIGLILSLSSSRLFSLILFSVGDVVILLLLLLPVPLPLLLLLIALALLPLPPCLEPIIGRASGMHGGTVVAAP